jgi:hypothetical protein
MPSPGLIPRKISAPGWSSPATLICSNSTQHLLTDSSLNAVVWGSRAECFDAARGGRAAKWRSKTVDLDLPDSPLNSSRAEFRHDLLARH